MIEETRQTLISYYKWIVNLSILIVGFSVAVVSAVDALGFSPMLHWGITLLLIAIFVNWLTVKRLVIYSVIENEQTENKLTKLLMNTSSNLKIYGLLQNWLFVVGLMLVILSFISSNRVDFSAAPTTDFNLIKEIGLTLSILGTLLVAFSVGKFPKGFGGSTATSVDGKEYHFAYIVQPFGFKFGIGVLVLGFFMQLNLAQEWLAQIAYSLGWR